MQDTEVTIFTDGYYPDHRKKETDQASRDLSLHQGQGKALAMSSEVKQETMDKWIKRDLERNADGLMGTIEHLEGWENWTETTMPCLAVDDLDVDRDTETTPDLLAADGMYGDDEGGDE